MGLLKIKEYNKMKHRKANELEREASYFAMCLLMPERLVKQEVEKLGGIKLTDNDLLPTLAKIFDVPLNAMAVRLSQIYPINKAQLETL